MRHTVLAIPVAAVLLVPAAAPAAPPKTGGLGDNRIIDGAGDMGIKVVVR